MPKFNPKQVEEINAIIKSVEAELKPGMEVGANDAACPRNARGNDALSPRRAALTCRGSRYLAAADASKKLGGRAKSPEITGIPERGGERKPDLPCCRDIKTAKSGPTETSPRVPRR